jgi:predicted ATPase/DNA-binding SARP family transcriptional activator
MPGCALTMENVDAPQDAAPEFRLLGPVEAIAGGRVLQLGGRTQRALLALLLVEQGRTVSVDRLAEALWHGRPPPAAAKTLRSYISRLRTVLGGERLVARPPGYALEVSPDRIDVNRFEELLREGREALERNAAGLGADRLRGALALWRGPALADVAEGGLLALEANRLDELRLVCLEQRIEADLQLGRHAELTAELERLVVEEPLRESLWRQLVLALYRSDRQAEALAAHRRARETLVELGLEPSEELKELERAVLRHEVEDAKPGQELHNLPAPLTSFVGRECELAEIERLLREHRLLTLTGIGGCGKTRLALEVAARQVGVWQRGVWLIDLTTLSDPALVPSAVASALAVPERTTVPTPRTLLEHLRDSELLLMLDNCEHLVDACGELAGVLLRSCPHLRMLATSRIALPTAGGLEYAVDPLPVPPESASVSELECSPSVQLFVERGRAVRSDRGWVDERLTTVARICRELDGLPLAIELAAARAKALSPEEIADRLGDRFRFLRSWRRIANPRHKTLQATMDWSYELLSDEERVLLSRLSVFAGGSTLDAIAYSCCDGSQERALHLTESLVDASLVNAESRSDSTRYRLLEMVRQYAAERLAELGGGDDIRRRHAEFFARQAEVAAAQIRSADVLNALAEDEGNFRSALSFSDGGREPDLMLRLAAALWFFWAVRDQAEEARGWLEQAVEYGDQSASPFRAPALRGLGATLGILGNNPESRRFLDEAVVLYRELGDGDGVARCLNNLGRIALEEGDVHDATTLFEEALAIHRQVDQRESLTPLRNLAEVSNRRGDLAKRRRLCEEVLVAARAWQDDLSVAEVLTDLAWIAAVERRHEDVAELAREALSLSGRVGNPGLVIACVLLAALVHASSERLDDAARLVGAASAESEQRGWPALPEGIYALPFEQLERELGDERYAAASAEGAALRFDHAVELAARALAPTAKRVLTP